LACGGVGKSFAMSQENVEAIQELWESWVNENDPAELGDLTLIDPDVVYEDDSLPDHVGESYVGHAGLRRAWARFAEPWTDFQVDLAWAREAGNQVVSYHRVRGKGRSSGLEMQASYAYVWTFGDGKVVALRSYGNPAEALEVAGLSE
jgi:ketosteroid isomerase-like protein